MEDQKIIALYFQRAETAILETKNKYSRLLLSISYDILKIMADAEECENDTYLKTWNAIPPKQPENLPAFLSKIVRNLSLDRYDSLHAEKRGGGEEEISGDYTEYKEVKEVNLEGRKVTLKGGAGKYSLAIWEENGFSYAISALENPMTKDEMLEIVNKVD